MGTTTWHQGIGEVFEDRSLAQVGTGKVHAGGAGAEAREPSVRHEAPQTVMEEMSQPSAPVADPLVRAEDADQAPMPDTSWCSRPQPSRSTLKSVGALLPGSNSSRRQSSTAPSSPGRWRPAPSQQWWSPDAIPHPIPEEVWQLLDGSFSITETLANKTQTPTSHALTPAMIWSKTPSPPGTPKQDPFARQLPGIGISASILQSCPHCGSGPAMPEGLRTTNLTNLSSLPAFRSDAPALMAGVGHLSPLSASRSDAPVLIARMVAATF